jgi:hypothetical protein
MMETHIKVLSVIDVILGALTAIVGAGLVVALGLAGVGIDLTEAPGGVAGAAFLGVAGVISGLVLLAIGVFGIVVGLNLRARKHWARVAQIIYGALQLPNFPFGTAFGIYSLWAMLSRSGQAEFEYAESRERRKAA